MRFSDRDFPGDAVTAPVLAVALLDQDADPGAPFNFVVLPGAFTDPNGDVLTYSATLAGGGALPTWLKFDAATRTFSGTPGAGDVGTLSIVVTASDGTGTASDTFELEIGDGTGGGDIFGTTGSDNLAGTASGENIFALAGNDIVRAGAGNDFINGAGGADELWGEAGADTFDYDRSAESPFRSGLFDTFMDFSVTDGDQIDVRGIDANTKRFGNQMFRFDAEGDGWASRGQISYWVDSGKTHVYGNTDKDKQAEFYLVINDEVELTAGDFAL